MGGRADVLGIQRWLLNLPRASYFTLVAFALLSWMGALLLALEFPLGLVRVCFGHWTRW